MEKIRSIKIDNDGKKIVQELQNTGNRSQWHRPKTYKVGEKYIKERKKYRNEKTYTKKKNYRNERKKNDNRETVAWTFGGINCPKNWEITVESYQRHRHKREKDKNDRKKKVTSSFLME